MAVGDNYDMWFIYLCWYFSACAQKESDVNASLIRCMLEDAHMDVNAVDIHKHSPLWYAVCSENTKAVQLLLQHGARNVMDNYECTVLMTAAKGTCCCLSLISVSLLMASQSHIYCMLHPWPDNFPHGWVQWHCLLCHTAFVFKRHGKVNSDVYM